MKPIQSRSQLILRAFLALSAAEGVIALVYLFLIPSEGRNAWLFGYSLPRLALGGLIFALLAVFAGLAVRAFSDPLWLQRCTDWLDKQLGPAERLASVSAALAYLILAGIAAILIFASPFAVRLGSLQAVYERSALALYWLIALSIQALAALGLMYAREYPAALRQRRALLNALLVMLLLSAAGFHWAILAFRLDLFISIPGWFWQFHQKEGLHNLYLLPLMAVGAFVVLRAVLRQPAAGARNLAALVLLGYLLQVGFGFIEGEGFESIRKKYAESTHKPYAEHASDRPVWVESIRQYEEKYGDTQYLSSKPPGVLSFYIATQKLSNLVNPRNTFEGRFVRLTTFAAYLYPLLSFLVLIVLYRLARPLLGEENALLPPVLYLFVPSVILMPLFLDQVLYPLLFTLLGLLLFHTVQRQSFGLALAAGAGIYLSVFFTFSLLPVIPFAAVLIVLDHIFHRRERSLLQPLKITAGLALGFFALFLVFKAALNYDFFLRYENAMAVHRYDDFYVRFNLPVEDSPDQRFQPSLQQSLDALKLNLLSFAAWSGFPFFLLFTLRGIKIAVAFLSRRSTARDIFPLSFLATFIALNLHGETAGEVARQWIFLLPVMALMAAPEVAALGRRRGGLYLVLALQFVTIVMTYLFQDFVT